MNKRIRILSYIAVFLLGAAVMLAVVLLRFPPMSKLDRIEQLIQQVFIGEADAQRMEDGAAAGMVAALGDRWSHYLTAEEYTELREQQENAYVGIGVTITADESGRGYRIILVEERGSAKAAGIQVGDIILSAEGQSAEGMTMEELRSIIRGPEGTDVTITLLRGEEELTLTVTRAMILTDVVTASMAEDGIGRVNIVNFDSRCAAEAIEAIETLREQGATALILDVRNNPGGYAVELVALLDYLLPEGDLFRTEDYLGEKSVDRSGPEYLDMPMAVLCNENSYSAAEFFAAAIQEYGAGIIVGAPTCGKGYFQYTFDLGDGSAAVLSVGKYFTPNGSSLIDIGVQPDVVVDVDDETFYGIYYNTIAPENDPQLQAAVRALKDGFPSE